LTPFYAALTRRPRLSYTLTTDSKSKIEKEGNFMRKPVLIAAGAAAALATAAVAVAATFTAGGITNTAATLNTTTATDVKTRTCTGGDGKAFTITDARYTGTADFTNPGLPGNEFDGPLAVHARTTVDSATHLGVVDGSFKVNDGDNRLSGRFTGVVDANGNLSGFLTGKSHGNHATVVGTLGGTFSTATGLTGKLGTTTLNPNAVLVGPVCKGRPEPPKPPKPAPKPQRFHIEGTLAINGNPPTSVTVTGKGPTTAMCTIDLNSPPLTGFAAGDKVEMACEGTNATPPAWFLRELKKHH
jgi:hypothetical protein